MNRFLRNGVLMTLSLLLTTSASYSIAQVTLPIANLGATSFEDGPAGPGWAVEQYATYGYGSQTNDGRGNKVPGTNTLTTNMFLEHLCHYSTHRILGGLYGVEVLVPFVDVGLNSVVAGDNRARGLGDLMVSPLMLVWNPQKIAGRLFFHRATVDIVVPTGKYSDQRPLNPGNNVVSVNPWYAFTYYPLKNSTKLEVSSRVHYLWNSENDAPFVSYGIKSMKAGQAFHENYAASYEVAKGIRVGFNGYAVQQFTDNRISGAAIANSRKRLFGSGPGAQFGGRGLWFYVNAYFESGARNTVQGTRVNFRVLKTFGGPEHSQVAVPPLPASM